MATLKRIITLLANLALLSFVIYCLLEHKWWLLIFLSLLFAGVFLYYDKDDYFDLLLFFWFLIGVVHVLSYLFWEKYYLVLFLLFLVISSLF